MWIYGGQTQVDQSVGDLSYLDLTKLTWVSVKTGAGTSVAFHTTALDAAGRLWTSGGVGLSGGATWKSKVYYFDTLNLLILVISYRCLVFRSWKFGDV